MKKNVELITMGFYVLILIVTMLTLEKIWFQGLFSRAHFLNWDAEHYNYIKEHGYKGFRVAFLPLFPLIWRFTNLNEYGIIILNFVIYISGFYLLIKEIEINKKEEILLYLSIPSSIFFYLPYTEALFFIFSLLIILGLKKNKYILIFIGLFLSILTRPAFSIFIPALILTELFNKNKKKAFVRIIIYSLITFLGILLVGIIQYTDTHEWFRFFSIQSGWGNKLQIPKLPFTSWAGGFIVRLDGFAFLIGTLSGLFLTALLLRIKWLKNTLIPLEVVFSIGYLGGITLLVLLYRGGSMFSLNRFIFATPFIIIIINFWIKQKIKFRIKHLVLFFWLIFLFWLLFGSYLHISQTLKFSLLSLYFLLLFTIKSDKLILQKISFILFIVLNFTFQIIFFVRFLNGEWVG